MEALLSNWKTVALKANAGMKGIVIICFLLSAPVFLGGFQLSGQAVTTPEYQVKAAFLFNFTHFVEWPANAFPEKQTPLVIGILGEDPFGSYLDETINGEKRDGHPLTINRYHKLDEVKSCHILFVNYTHEEDQAQIIANLKGRNILTVSDATGFTRNGGMVLLFTENNKIRLKINLSAVKSGDLTISSKLLRLAEIVDSKTK